MCRKKYVSEFQMARANKIDGLFPKITAEFAASIPDYELRWISFL